MSCGHGWRYHFRLALTLALDSTSGRPGSADIFVSCSVSETGLLCLGDGADLDTDLKLGIFGIQKVGLLKYGEKKVYVLD